jgi:phenylpyruvate tautomerase PptA (4-oxalocrotonate tautomerase family)
MPFLCVECQRTTSENKQLLVKTLSEKASKILNLPKSVVITFIKENDIMTPDFNGCYVILDHCILDKETKAKLVKTFAQTASELLGIDISHVACIIRTHELENIALGGTLLCDLTREQFATLNTGGLEDLKREVAE